MLSILAVGGDVRLLTTRAAVLRCTGADVVQAGPHVALELLEAMTFDVVVMCHSLEPLEAQAVMAAAQSGSATRVVQVVPNAAFRPDYDSVGAVHVAEARPPALLEKVLQLLNTVERAGPDFAPGPVTSLTGMLDAGAASLIKSDTV